MEVTYAYCAGLDVHKKNVVACRIIPNLAGWQREIRTFSTMTKGLLELADWLKAGEVTIVAMESTGVYWRPVFNILESLFEVILALFPILGSVPDMGGVVAVWRKKYPHILDIPQKVGENRSYLGQCRAYQTCAGSQDRCKRCPVDC